MPKVLYTWMVLSAPGVPILVQNKMIFCIYNIMSLIGTKKLIYRLHGYTKFIHFLPVPEKVLAQDMCVFLSLYLCIPL